MDWIKTLFTNLFALIPNFILLGVVVMTVVVTYQNNIGFDQWIELLRIIVWPATVLVAVFFFRKVLTYLFFSMDEFNFFGAKGTLKNVRDLVNEKVDQLYTYKIAEEQRESEYKMKLDELGAVASGQEEIKLKLERVTQIAVEEIKKNKSLNETINNLIKQVSELQRQIYREDESYIDYPDESAEVVGSTKELVETSDNTK